MTTPLPEGWTRALLSGLGQLLADAGVGDWNPDGFYTGGQIALTINGLPTSPDRAISLTSYGLGSAGDDVEQTDSSVLVQVRARGGPDPREADDLLDGVFDVVHGLADRTLASGVHVLLATRKIIGPPSRDGSNRVERADSYELMCDRPSGHRT